MHWFARCLSILGLLALSSCALGRNSENATLDPIAVQQLAPGKTTATEVVNLLGAPSEVVQLGRGSAYRYDHKMQKFAGFFLVVLNFGNADTRSDRVWTFFNENQVLTHVGSTFQSHHAQYAMPWENIHEASDGLSRDTDRPGLGGK